MAKSGTDIGDEQHDEQHKGCPGSVHCRQIERCLSGMFGGESGYASNIH